MLNISRPTIYQTLMNVAYEFSNRSTCSRLNVGAVIADARGVILSSGYNGAIAGMEHCDHTNTDEPCRLAIHAEANAVLWAARRGIAIEGQEMYSTHEPCYECSKMIAQAGIAKVYFAESYGRNTGFDLLWATGVEVYRITR